MKRLLLTISVLMSAFAPSVARPADQSTSYGVGPHGYDWMIGTWSCTNPAPSPAGGPAHQTQTITRTNSGAIFLHTVGTNFDVSNYNVYVPSKKMWVSPISASDGTYGNESTSQTGKTIVWVGSTYFPDSGKTMPTRDTIVNSANKYTDLGELNSGGVWKKNYSLTCTRT